MSEEASLSSDKSEVTWNSIEIPEKERIKEESVRISLSLKKQFPPTTTLIYRLYLDGLVHIQHAS